MKKQCGWQKKDSGLGKPEKQNGGLGQGVEISGARAGPGSASEFGEWLFEETVKEHEACTANRCEMGKNCCALKPLLETAILEAGHEVIFYPKFHCELNFIEHYWGFLKCCMCENCTYSFPELEKTIFEAMKSVTGVYNGLMEEQRKYTEKVYKSQVFV